MYKSLLDMYKDMAPHLKADMMLYNKVRMFRLSWAQKSDDYMEFLGGNLTGVHPVRFSTQDESILYTDIFEVDPKALQKAVYNTQGIDKNFRTISNPTYITLMYIAHLFMHSNLKKEIITDAVIEISHIFCYKCIASLIHHYFKYNVDVATAKAVNERLNNKYLIRKHANWQAVFDHRAKDLLPKGIHYKRLERFSTDDSCRILSDYQTKIRELIKNIYAVLIEVNKANEKITTSSLFQKGEDGNITLRDITNSRDRHIVYIRGILNSPVDFVNEDIIDLMVEIYNNVTKEEFTKLLMFISQNNSKELQGLDHIVEESIIICINILLAANITVEFQRNIYKVMVALKNGTVSISKHSEKVKQLRAKIPPIVKYVSKKNRKTFLVNISAMLIAYFFLRSIYK